MELVAVVTEALRVEGVVFDPEGATENSQG